MKNNTALHLAAKKNSKKMIELLISKGADISIKDINIQDIIIYYIIIIF